MKIAILARAVYARRVLEFLKFTAVGKYEFTGTKYFNNEEVSVFIFESTDAEIANAEVWIKGMFNSNDVITLRFVNDVPLID